MRKSPGLLYLSREDVAAVGPSMADIIAALERMFKEKGRGRVEMPPKPGIHPRPDAFIHAMPAYIPSMGAAGLKWVSGYPQNQKKGLPYIHGLIVLNDPATGAPTCVMDGTWITAQRTGAATAVAAKFLARPDSESAGIVACGVQGRSNLEALAAVFRLRRVKAYDVRPETAKRFAREMGLRLGLEIEAVARPEDAVRGLDLVVTSGPILKKPRPVIEAGWLAPGAFASPVDFDSYWTPAALRQIDRLATDDHAQFGYYKDAGYFLKTPRPYADLGELACGPKKGRTSYEQRTMSINLGLALEDMAAAVLVHRRALQRGAGIRLPL
ncbi:MAG: ornithine cyclodeaminase family protein [Elusimicrobiota bacterium]|nr:ornithine cyclodeaminase family protein [Elusimicrobiota bacterium]